MFCDVVHSYAIRAKHVNQYVPQYNAHTNEMTKTIVNVCVGALSKREFNRK